MRDRSVCPECTRGGPCLLPIYHRGEHAVDPAPLLAQLDAINALHRPVGNDMPPDRYCSECSGDHGSDPTPWPCPTSLAVKPAVTTDGDAST